MDSLVPVVVVLFVLSLLAAFAAKHKNRPPGGPWPFYAKKPLTAPEQVLYWRLVKALPGDIVLAQVQLSRFLGVKKGSRFHEWNNRINRLSADFVICGKDASVLAVVELDDATHAKPARVEADARKDRAIEAAGLRVIRWKVSAIPDDATIAMAVRPPPITELDGSLSVQ